LDLAKSDVQLAICTKMKAGFFVDGKYCKRYNKMEGIIIMFSEKKCKNSERTN